MVENLSNPVKAKTCSDLWGPTIPTEMIFQLEFSYVKCPLKQQQIQYNTLQRNKRTWISTTYIPKSRIEASSFFAERDVTSSLKAACCKHSPGNRLGKEQSGPWILGIPSKNYCSGPRRYGILLPSTAIFLFSYLQLVWA